MGESYKDTPTGPSDRSRTCGLLNPIQALYQTELHPDSLASDIYYTMLFMRSQYFYEKKRIFFIKPQRACPYDTNRLFILKHLLLMAA